MMIFFLYFPKTTEKAFGPAKSSCQTFYSLSGLKPQLVPALEYSYALRSVFSIPAGQGRIWNADESMCYRWCPTTKSWTVWIIFIDVTFSSQTIALSCSYFILVLKQTFLHFVLMSFSDQTSLCHSTSHKHFSNVHWASAQISQKQGGVSGVKPTDVK